MVVVVVEMALKQMRIEYTLAGYYNISFRFLFITTLLQIEYSALLVYIVPYFPEYETQKIIKTVLSVLFFCRSFWRLLQIYFCYEYDAVSTFTCSSYHMCIKIHFHICSFLAAL